MLLLHSTHHHAKVASFADHTDAPGLEQFLNRLRHLLREPFLDLKPPGKHIDDARDLTETDHFRIRQVGNVHFAKERQQVMFTHAEELDIPHDHEFVVFHVEQSTVDNMVDVGGIPAGQITKRLFASNRGAQETFPFGILAQFAYDLAYVV